MWRDVEVCRGVQRGVVQTGADRCRGLQRVQWGRVQGGVEGAEGCRGRGVEGWDAEGWGAEECGGEGCRGVQRGCRRLPLTTTF